MNAKWEFQPDCEPSCVQEGFIMRRLMGSALLVVLAVFLVSCGGGPGVTTTPTATVAVSVAAAAANPSLSQTDQVTATVTGSSNTAVTWSVSGSGSISATGLYTAPADLPATTTVTVTATSAADASKSASAVLTLSSTEAVAFTSTTSLSQTLSSSAQLAAAVSGTSSDTGLTWTATGAGAVSASGLYTAPDDLPATTTVTVTATSTADKQKSASATINLVSAVQVSVAPGASTVQAGASQSLTSSVQGSNDNSVTWTLLDQSGNPAAASLGMISASGLYTAPASATQNATLTAVATAKADNSRSASASLTLVPAAASSSTFAVLASNPAPGATNVDPGLPLTVSLSGQLDVTTLNAGSVSLRDAIAGTSVAAALSYDSTTQILTITPQVPLDANGTYALTVSSSLANTSGTALSQAYGAPFVTMPPAMVNGLFDSPVYTGSGAIAYGYGDAAITVASDGTFRAPIQPDGVSTVSVLYNGHVYEAAITATPANTPASFTVDETSTAAFLVLFSEGLIGTNPTQTQAMIAVANADPGVAALALQLAMPTSTAWLTNANVAAAFDTAVNSVLTDLAQSSAITQAAIAPGVQGGRLLQSSQAASSNGALTANASVSGASCSPTITDLSTSNYVSVQVDPTSGQYRLHPSFNVAAPQTDWVVDVVQVDPTTLPAVVSPTSLPTPLANGLHELMYLPAKTDPHTADALRDAIQTLVTNIPMQIGGELAVSQNQSNAYLFTMYSGGMADPNQSAIAYLQQGTEGGLGTVLNPIAFSSNLIAAIGTQLGSSCRNAVIQSLFASGSSVGLQGATPTSLSSLLDDMVAELNTAFTAAGPSCSAAHLPAVIDEIGSIKEALQPQVQQTNNTTLQSKLQEAASLVDRADALWDTVTAVNATLVNISSISTCSVAKIAVAPTSLSLTAGSLTAATSGTLTATATDGSSAAVSGATFTWTSQNPNVATVTPTAGNSAQATVTATGAGVTHIQVNSGAATAVLVPVTVTSGAAPLLVVPNPLVVPVGTKQVLHVVAPTSATGTVSWTSSDQTVATVGQDGTVTGVKVGGPITITATLGSSTGSVQATVIPASAPAITEIQPQPVPVGTNVTLDVFGAFFQNGATAAITYSGATTTVGAAQVTVLNSGHMQVGVNLTAGTATSATLVITNPDKSTGQSTFAVQLSSTATIQTSPNPPVANQTFTFSLTGAGYDPASAKVIFAGPGCGSGCTVANAALTTKTATNLVGPVTLSAGVFNVYVQNATGAATQPIKLTVPSSANAPVLSAFQTTPRTPVSGSNFAFVITGTGFDPATVNLVFTGPGCETGCAVSNSVLASLSATQVAGTATLGTGTFAVIAQNATGGASNAISFNVVATATTPVLTAIATTPNPPAAGQAFTFLLTGTAFDPASAQVIFAGTGCASSSACTIGNSALSTKSQTQIQGSLALAAGTYTVTVKNAAGTSGAVTLTVPAPAAPVLSSITTTPGVAPPNQTFIFTISGSNFDPGSAFVTMIGPGCTGGCTVANSKLSISSGLLGGEVSLAAGTYSVTVQNGSTGKPSNALSLVVATAAATPTLTSISTSPNPPVGGQSFVFSLKGTNFDPGSVAITFIGPGCTGGCSVATASLTSVSSTVVYGTTTLAAGTFTVTAKNSAGAASAAVTLTVASAPTQPTITAITTTPAQPLNNRSFGFTITGTNFVAGSVKVSFTGVGSGNSGTPACSSGCTVSTTALTGVTSTSLSGTTELSAGTYSVTVANGSGPASTARSLIVITPLLTATVTPTSGTIGQTQFQFSGSGATPNGSVKGTTTYPDGSSHILTMTADATGAYKSTAQVYTLAGRYAETDLDSTTGASSQSYSFSVTAGTPTLTAITTTPTAAVAGPLAFAITGSGFDPASAQVTFNGGGCGATGCVVGTSLLSTHNATLVAGPISLTAGTYSVTVQNSAGGTASAALSLTVGARVLSAAASPATGVAGQTLFNISGAGAVPGGTVIGAVVYPDGNTHSVKMTATTSGSYSVSGGFTETEAGLYTEIDTDQTSGGQSKSYSWSVTSAAPTPTITSISTSPNPPVADQSFNFTLTGTGYDPGSAKVIFTGTGCSAGCVVPNNVLTAKSATQLQGSVLLGAGSFTVTVQNLSGSPSAGSAVTVSAATNTLVLTQLLTSPNPPVAGQQFAFAALGSGFGSAAKVTFTGPGCVSGCTVAATGGSGAITLSSSTQIQGSFTLTQAGTYTATVQNSTGNPSAAVTVAVAAAVVGAGGGSQ